MMSVRPFGPLQVELVAGSNGDRALGVGGIETADDIGVGVSLSGQVDRAIASVRCSPSCHDRGILHVGEAADVPAGVEHTVDHDTCNVAVCCHGGNKGSESKKAARHNELKCERMKATSADERKRDRLQSMKLG